MEKGRLFLVLTKLASCIVVLCTSSSDCLTDDTGVIFNLTKMFPFDEDTDTSTLAVGSRLPFRLEITFPVGPIDMLVELFTPENESAIMLICDSIKTQVGMNLQMDEVQTEYDSITGSKQYDRAILNLGNVTGDQSCSNGGSDCVFVIEYEALMVETPTPSNNETYWISAGAEYKDEENVWVGQASVRADDNATSSTLKPEFNFTGPAELEIGSAGKFSVQMTSPHPSKHITFDAFAPFNGTEMMSICRVEFISVGENLQCGFDPSVVQESLHKEGVGAEHTRGHVDLGTLINKRSRELLDTGPEDAIDIQFYVTVTDDASYIGDDYWVGGAFDIGGIEIWAAQRSVSIIDKQDATFDPGLEFDDGVSGTLELPINVVTAVNFSVHVPEGSNGIYEIVVNATSLDPSTTFRLCNMFIVDIGENMPCVDRDVEAVYSNEELSEVATVTLKAVVSTKANATPEASSIRLKAMVIAVNTTNSLKLDVSLNYANGQTKQISLDVTAIDGPTGVGGIVNTMPVFNMSIYDKDSVSIGATERIELDIILKKNVQYSKMDIEFVLPIRDLTPQLTVCRVEIEEPGDNVFCVKKNIVNNNVKYYQYYTDMNDRGSIKLGPVCQMDVTSSDNPEDDSIPTVMYIRVEKDAASQEDISVGVTFSETRMWVARMDIPVEAAKDVGAVSPPYVHVYPSSDLTPVGYIQRYSLLIKTHPGEIADIKLNLTPQDSFKLAIVDIRLKSKGKNLPCVREENFTVTNIPTISFELGLVTNVGNDSHYANDISDVNSLTVELVVQLSNNVNAGTDTPTFDVVVKYNSTHDVTRSVTVNPTSDTTGVDTNHTDPVPVNLTIIDEGSDLKTASITKGEAKVAKLTLDMSKWLQNITISFEVSGMAQICEVFVSAVGENMLGVKSEQIKPEFSNGASGQDKSLASLNIGYVYNSDRSMDAKQNQIEVRAVTKVLMNSELTNGESITLTATVTANGVESTGTVNFSMSDDVDDGDANLEANATIMSLNVTDVEVKIGEEITLPVALHIPSFTSSKVKLFVYTDIENISAAITVKDVLPADAGTNIACLIVDGKVDSSLALKFQSTFNTSQKDVAVLALGRITNHGASHASGTYVDGDDDILINVTLQMADPPGADDGARYKVSIWANLAGFTHSHNTTFTVNRSGNEQPSMILSATVNNRTTSDAIFLDVELKHGETSEAECVDVSVFFYLPAYITYVGANESNLEMDTTVRNTVVEIK
ncbi:hypothetical protein ScPMuIL_009043, partial [Solemya velum]